MICIYIFLILIILYIISKFIKKKIVKGGFIEDAENGHTNILPYNNKKNVNISGNEINIKSNSNNLNGPQLSSHLPNKDGHAYIRPGKKNHNINIDNASEISLQAKGINLNSNIINIKSNSNNLNGPQFSSHLPNMDGHAYIRPGKKNHNINIDNANQISLGSKSINLKSKQLCFNDVCINSNDFRKIKNRASNNDHIYPVGSIYISVKNTNPSKIWPGTKWVIFSPGRVLVGLDRNNVKFNNSEETGGSYTHRLTIAQMPQHSHLEYAAMRPHMATSWSYGNNGALATGMQHRWSSYTGSSQVHNITQPYIVTYMWKRTL